MPETRNLWIVSVVALAVAITVAAACSADPMRMVGDAMVDAGHLLDASADALVPDAAAAPMTFDTTCNTMLHRTAVTTTSGSTSTVDSYQWYADIDIAGLDPTRVRGVDSVLCDYEDFYAPGTFSCAAGTVCTGDTIPGPVATNCQAVSGAVLTAGHVRVYCGSRTRSVIMPATGTPTTSDGGWTAHTAHVYVDTL